MKVLTKTKVIDDDDSKWISGDVQCVCIGSILQVVLVNGCRCLVDDYVF